MEHRWGERSKLNIPVQVDCGSRGVVLGVMRDVSASGGFLCTAAQIPLLTNVHVDFSTARGQRRAVEAQVVRRALDGFGLEWMELAPRTVIDLLSAAQVFPGLQPLPFEAPAPAPSVAAPVPPQLTATVLEETARG
jgi:hypothetical protein